METERKNITAPSDWWAAFVEAATDSGQNLSEWLGDCGVANLPADVAERLSARRGPGRPKVEES